MRVEEIALRQEIRQMLNEAGFNKNTMKDLVKEVLQDELKRAINQAIAETNMDIDNYIKKNINTVINKSVDRVVADKLHSRLINTYFDRMKVDVKVEPIMSIGEEDV